MKSIQTLPFRRGRLTQDGPLFDAVPGKEYRMVYAANRAEFLVAICCDDQHAEFVANACNAHDELVQDNGELREQVGRLDAELMRARGDVAQLREVQAQLVAALKMARDYASVDLGYPVSIESARRQIARIDAALVAAEAK